MQFLSPHSEDEFSNFIRFLRLPITLNFIEILAHKACLAVRLPPSIQQTSESPPETPSTFRSTHLHSFIRDLVVGSRVQATTLFGSMVYLERLKWNLPNKPVSRCASPHLALIACLILAGKFLNDSAPKNKHWAQYSKIFQVHELNEVELVVLGYLKFDLSVSNPELIDQYRAFSHLTLTSANPPLASPSVSHFPQFPRTPQSAVFPPSTKTPFFPSESPESNRPPVVVCSPVRSNVSGYNLPPKLAIHSAGAAPYPYPSSLHTRPSEPNHFPLSKSKRIGNLSESGSMLYRRRTLRRQLPGQLPGQLSGLAGSNFSSGPSTGLELKPRLNPLLLSHHPYSMDSNLRSNMESFSAPLSAPLPNQNGSRIPRPTFTLKSNVPLSARLPPPPNTLLSHSTQKGSHDPSLKLAPIRSFTPPTDRLPRIMEPDIYLGP